ncbi:MULTISPECIES: hypothetical protein [unclassified Clostridium]|uniref:hypothetical protein n=1 Tax=unclassified Clostridium TaxID=2614128 RepID=UPI0002983A95|nr:MULTISPECIES: hypothetical protein [unclassified Clostridium]EKQ52749.1 MAG: hypothetical protein A370_04054 [Clostridium sp. Maddingley MBC34-26]
MNDFKVLNQWKNGNKSLSPPIDISDYIIDINIDRRSGTNVNECRLNCDGIPRDKFFVRKSITNDENVVTDPMNKIEIYINNKIQFTGWLMNYKINSNNQIVELTLHDDSVLLKRGLNVHPRPKVTYTETYNTTVIVMLAGLLNVNVNIDPEVVRRAVLLNEYTIENGQNVYDAIVSLCESLDAVISADKDGTIRVKPSYIDYTSGYDFNYDEVQHIVSASTTIAGSKLKPTIMIKNDSNEDRKLSWVFTDKEMLEYLNGWDDVEIVESDLAINQSVAQNIAHQRLVLMWRGATSQDIVTAEGNIDMDVDKVVQTTIDDNTDVYRVIGLTTTFNSAEGYIDKLTLECIHPHNIEYLGDMIDCKGLRDAIIAQAMKYLNIPFNPNQYYRTDQGEWGMVDEALITHTLIDLGMRSEEELTTDQGTITTVWCDEISADQVKPADIVAWPNDCHEMGWYLGDNKILEVWGSVISNMTPTAMQYRGYFVKVIEMDSEYGVNAPRFYRLKELKDCV